MLQEQACAALVNLAVNSDNQIKIAAAGEFASDRVWRVRVMLDVGVCAHDGCRRRCIVVCRRRCIVGYGDLSVTCRRVSPLYLLCASTRTCVCVLVTHVRVVCVCVCVCVCAPSMARAGGIERIITAMVSHKWYMNLQEHACRALQNIGRYNKELQDRIRGARGVESIQVRSTL